MRGRMSAMKLLFLILAIQGCWSYKAAVVEFHPEIYSSSSPDSVSKNLAQFIELIATAGEQGADIIVFPEIGLNGYGLCQEDMLVEVPSPRDGTVPCNTTGYSAVLTNLSCTAIASNIYVVVNLAEKEPCDGDNCAKRGYNKYNTNVVFDRLGAVVARYRKFNLFGEAGTNVTAVAELSVFDTDFGGRFGTFTCFDLMFDSPALQLIQQLDIKNIVFTTAWFSELPFLTAVQAQAMWAYKQNVNLLGSGYNDPSVGSAGSGIYLGNLGAVQATFPDSPTTKLIIAEVPDSPKSVGSLKQAKRKPLAADASTFLKQDDLSLYESVLLDDLAGDGEVCSGDFCCQFTLSMAGPTDVDYRYRAVAFDGVRTFDEIRTGGVQTCGIISCFNSSLASCGARIEPQHTFGNISISGRFKGEETLIMPSTVTQDLMPLSVDQFTWQELCYQDVCQVSLSTSGEVQDLLTFAIYSRVFSRDGQPVESTAAHSQVSIILSCFIGFYLLISR